MIIRRSIQLTSLLCFWLFTRLTYADYANVNGISMYYEVHGNPHGTPVVMLHGGYDDSDMWAIETGMLAPFYRIIEIDSRGHGRTTDSAAPITYELMADDTLKLLDAIGISTAHFIGWSDGAVIASQIAIGHPERVNQLVLFGAAFQADAYVDLFTAALNQPALFNAFIDSTFGLKYHLTSPTPDYWPTFRDKLLTLWKSPCYFSGQPTTMCLAPLQAINAPTLVVAGEQEIIKRSHTQAVAANIPNARLKFVPLASHFLPKLRPVLSGYIILNFLNN